MSVCALPVESVCCTKLAVVSTLCLRVLDMAAISLMRGSEKTHFELRTTTTFSFLGLQSYVLNAL